MRPKNSRLRLQNTPASFISPPHGKLMTWNHCEIRRCVWLGILVIQVMIFLKWFPSDRSYLSAWAAWAPLCLNYRQLHFLFRLTTRKPLKIRINGLTGFHWWPVDLPHKALQQLAQRFPAMTSSWEPQLHTPSSLLLIMTTAILTWTTTTFSLLFFYSFVLPILTYTSVRQHNLAIGRAQGKQFDLHCGYHVTWH